MHSAMTIKQQSRVFFRALGKHITNCRKSIGMTQAELASALGVSQQSVFAYELGDRRVSVLVLVKLAAIFQTTPDELIRRVMPSPPRSPKLQHVSPACIRLAGCIQTLSKTRQRFVRQIVDVLIEEMKQRERTPRSAIRPSPANTASAS